MYTRMLSTALDAFLEGFQKFCSLSQLKRRIFFYVCVWVLLVLSCFVFFMSPTNVVKALFFNSVSDKSNVYENQQPLQEKYTTPKRVLVVSFFRSGTTWFGELLSNTPNSFYIFEPLHLMENEIVKQELHNLLSTYRGNRLKELYHCGISQEFVNHLRWAKLYKNPNCTEDCKSMKQISRHCTSSDYVFIKTVRYYLYEVEDLLVKPSLKNLKVIFLTRDPRGVVNSLSKMSEGMKLKVTAACPKVREDIQSYRILKETYPNQIFHLRYEDIARYPFENALAVWRFINDDENEMDIPSKWKEFLDFSSKEKGKSRTGSYFTETKSTHEWQNWRSSITQDLFEYVESECDDVLISLGYRLLDDFTSVRNLSIPIMVDEK